MHVYFLNIAKNKYEHKFVDIKSYDLSLIDNNKRIL